VAVLIPDHYVPDLNVRLSLYRRISDAERVEEREQLAAEMIDRFGPLPAEAEQLLRVVTIKGLCRQAGVSKLDIGPKGAVISFLNDEFANPMSLVALVQRKAGGWKVRPDHKLVVKGEWPTPTTGSRRRRRSRWICRAWRGWRRWRLRSRAGAGEDRSSLRNFRGVFLR
jgi:transcription-repair coupling factor (superfamily II helicase)